VSYRFLPLTFSSHSRDTRLRAWWNLMVAAVPLTKPVGGYVWHSDIFEYEPLFMGVHSCSAHF
jgi:hypothetical protein